MPRLLIIDDSKAARDFARRAVKGLDIDTEEAMHGIAGLSKLAKGEYDLVLLDLNLPVVDDPKMLGRMRQLGDKTPVLLVTASAKPVTISKLMRLGIEGYILKPFKEEELRKKVATILQIELPQTSDDSAKPADASCGSKEDNPDAAE